MNRRSSDAGAPVSGAEIISIADRRPDAGEDGFPSCIDPADIDQGELERFSRESVPSELVLKLDQHLARCEYCAALLREYRDINNQKHELQRYRTRRAVVIALATAAGVAAVVAPLFLFNAPAGAHPGKYAVARVRGTNEKLMGGESRPSVPKEPWTFSVESNVEISLTPEVESDEARGRPVLGVFVADPGGKLVRVEHVRITDEGPEHFPSFRVQASGGDLFGETSGEKTLVFALAAYGGELDVISGHTLDEARERSQDIGLLVNAVVYHGRASR